MFLKTILDASEKNGTLSFLAADDRGTGEEWFVLSLGAYKRLVKQCGLTPVQGMEITEPLYDAFREGAQQTAALQEGARLLAGHDRSVRELTRLLTGKGYMPEAVAFAVQLLQKKGYLNEGAACQRYAESAVQRQGYGRRRIADYLRSHGYGAEEARQAAEAIPAEVYREALDKQIRKRTPAVSALDRAAQQKLTAALLRRGFTAEEVREALRKTAGCMEKL